VDLEVIFRALWRRRVQLLLCALVFAVIVPVIFTVLISAKYASSTQVQVYPPPDIDTSISATYPTDPDRYVATQVAIISSRAAAAQVASELKLDTTTVTKMASVSQIEKSDALTITATDHDASTAASVSSKLADNYVKSSRAQTLASYASALKNVNDQITSTNNQIQQLQTTIAAAGQNASSSGPLQNQLGTLQTSLSTLITRQQLLQADAQTAPSNTRIISIAAVSKQATGTGKTTLAIYGAALGFGLAALVITLGTTPGRSLEELDSLDEIQGVEVLGVLEHKRGGGGRNDVTDVHGLRIGSELRTIIKHKGQVTVVPIGRNERMKKACGVLVRMVEGQNAGEDDEAGMVRSDSFASFLELPEPENQRVVLAVDVEKISRRDLVDTLVTLGALGTEVMGLVGVR
jgi:capsular polysaccharide biosynthesis protein